MKATTLALAALTVLLLQPLAFAQTYRGSIRGTVADPQQGAIVGATVKLTNKETNETRTVTSNGDGVYTVSSLPTGTYRLEISASGFKQFVAPAVVLQVNQDMRLDVALEVGAISDTVDDFTDYSDVEIKRDSASVGTVITEKQIAQLPLDGRNFLELALLVPGAAPAANGSAGSVRGDFAFNVNGAREDANNFLLDGVYNVDPKLNTFSVKPPVDGVQEFEVLTSTYDAAFGRNAGAQVNVVTKAGSNELHGTAYEFHRNARTDARNFFVPADQPDPKYIRNQFGFSVGGAIKRDRTWFFGDYEGTRVREGVTQVTNVPTLQERNGDFSHSLFRRPFNPFTQQPFDGGIIPVFFQNPIGRAIANLYPLPNRNVPFANFVSSPVSRDRNDVFDVRVDSWLNKAAHFTARYSFGDRDLFEPFTGPTFSLVPGFGDVVPRRSQNLMLSEDHMISPKLVNEARFAFNRVASAVTQEGGGTSLNRQVGLPELSRNARDFGLSFITITGFSPLGDEFNNPQQSAVNTFQLLDNLSYVRGQHFFKFGADFRDAQQNAFRDVQSRGFLTFSDQFPLTGNALADLLLGFPALAGGAHVDNAQHLRTKSYNFYVNDSWRATPRLTLNAGLRYELNTPPVDAEDRANLYDPATRSLVRVGAAGIPRGGFGTDRNNFAPRVGLAWTLDDDTVVRAGYGVYYDQSALAPGEALYFNAPYFDLNLFFSLQGLPLTLNNPFPQNFPFALPKTALAVQRDLRTPYMQQWNLNVQRQLGRSRVLEIGYVGSKGTKLLTARDINQPRPSPVSPNLRPNPFFDDIDIIESRANSN
ncbi:MAG: hypothetical protein QOF61_263, partial [Acidobacteriota bacterium]|nr:hypothetical protein [Acidobacteriota bacterium]